MIDESLVVVKEDGMASKFGDTPEQKQDLKLLWALRKMKWYELEAFESMLSYHRAEAIFNQVKAEKTAYTKMIREQNKKTPEELKISYAKAAEKRAFAKEKKVVESGANLF